MSTRFPPQARPWLAFAGISLVLALSGCAVEQPNSRATPRTGPEVLRITPPVTVVNDYDYYPGYETYYSRSNREYIYREGDRWVRRPERRDVALNVLLSSPVVQLTFHDAPEQHHNTVIQSFPPGWMPAGQGPEPRDLRGLVREDLPPSDPQHPPLAVTVVDGYDYYPRYEIYYSRERREYVYRDGNTWVRRPEPRGVKQRVLDASPMVRLAFHDSPEQHHGAVTQQYPKNWSARDEKDDDKRGRHVDERR